MEAQPQPQGGVAPSGTYDDHFTLANIPYGIVSTKDNANPRVATRLYGRVFILAELHRDGHLGVLDGDIVDALSKPKLNALASLPRSLLSTLRQNLQAALAKSLEDAHSPIHACSYAVADVHAHVPVDVGDFSDFSCSRDHVLNAGEAVMGVRKLPPGFLHYPVGYGGRSSSIVPSGTDIRRPLGQYRGPGGGVVFGPSQRVDFELEVACIIGKPSKFGAPVDINSADEHIFGLVLLNDWSARDIQGLEMDPLGPFNGKSFGTTVSPWVVTLDALEPFEVPGVTREIPNCSYLDDKKEKNSYALNLDVTLISAGTATTLCKSKLEWLYWTFRDMVAHQTINGCSIRPGDMLATGTVSGSTEGSHGCLLESTRGGKQSVQLVGGGSRTFLENQDVVRMTGWAGEVGSPSCVGFGDCWGTLIG